MLRSSISKFQLSTVKLKFYPITRNFASIKPEKSLLVEVYELQQEHIDEAIKATPVLSNVSAEIWHDAHKKFLNHGLSTNGFLQIVTGNPKILMRSTQKIVDTIEYWRSCQFGEYFLFLLIKKYPILMDINDQRRLLKQISFLQSHVSTHKNVWKLLMNCPSLIQQRKTDIGEKLLYMKEKMHIEIPEIIKSEALEKSFADIRCRHVFLERLSLFKPRSLRADPDEASKNPRLYKITDTSDKTFATKICHVSLEEYEAFKELYARELERTQKEQNALEDELLSDDEN